MERLTYRRRRFIVFAAAIIALAITIFQTPDFWQQQSVQPVSPAATGASGLAFNALQTLEIKGRAPKTGYVREEFGDGWAQLGMCDMRNVILNRDLQQVALNEKCKVMTGILHDPYTGSVISFQRGDTTSDKVQIDHVVALSNAWQTGAQQLSPEERRKFANDPLELLAVDGRANQQKSDGDTATWLPPNKAFRCQYVARQIAVKQKYRLWVTRAEYDAMGAVLGACPDQLLPIASAS